MNATFVAMLEYPTICAETDIALNARVLHREKWIEDRTTDLLPIPYFHIVFTLPADLNPLVLRNKKLLYSLLFKTSSETLLELTKDAKYLGAQIGFISLLHTWGQNLMDHPHVHCIVTGGGLSFDQQKWCPVKNVLQYLGRYTHRIAISNQRIVNLTEGQVTFKWKDYADNNQVKLMTLDAMEFIRRFLLHVLPNGFMKIRYYGIMSNRNRKTLLIRCKELLDVSEGLEVSKESWQEMLLRLTGKDLSKCPSCGKGTMVLKSVIAESKLLRALA